MKVDAVILAGGKLKGSTENKAFIRLGEQTLLDRSIKTLRDCSYISKIIVTSTPHNYFPKMPVDDLLGDTTDLVENIAAALARVKSEKVLLVASDIPLMQASHVKEFIDSCNKVEADIFYPLIPKSSMGKFGSMKRTYFKLDRIDFTGGNIMLLKKDIFVANLGNARNIYTNRKSPLKLAGLVGIMFLFKLALGRLSVDEAEGKTSQILGGKVKGIIIARPEIGSDIDKEEDLQFMQTFFTEVSMAGKQFKSENK